MDAPPEKSPLKKRLAIFLPVLALILAYIAFGPQGREWIDRLTTTDTDIRADIEKIFEGFKTYQALKEHYPEAYEDLIILTLKDMRDGTDPKQALAKGAEFTSNLRRQNAQYYAMASIERLRLSLSAQIPQYKYLKTAYGYKACNALAVKGGVAITQMLGPEFLKDETLLHLMDEATGYFFRTAAEGKKLNLRHEQPTGTDWQVAADYLRSKGMTDADLQLINEPAKHVDDERLCDVTAKFYENITAMDNDATKRIVPYLAAAAASG